jgi:hypothetical protein
MLRRRPVPLFLIPILTLLPALTVAACVGGNTEDESTFEVQEAIPIGVHLVGTYTGNSHQAGNFSQLVLKTDGTYHAMIFVICKKAPCPEVEQDGHYSLFQRDTIAYFQTYDASGTAIARVQYALNGDTLNLRKLEPSATWTPMERSPTAWCATDHDCATQDLLPGPCAGQYLCDDQSACNYHCGVAPDR